MPDDFEAQVQQLLFNNSTASGDCRAKLAKKIAQLRYKMDAPMPLMDLEKFKRLSGKIFTAAVHHAEANGQEFMDGDPEHWFRMRGEFDAFEVAADYFEDCDFKYSQ